MVYEEPAELPSKGTAKPGNRERVENLRWAQDHCNGVVRVVMVKAVDIKAYPREIAACFPRDDLIMKITDFDAETGQFRAISIERIEPNGPV